MVIKNKRGWVKIVEAFTAILIIAAIVLIVVQFDQDRRTDTSSTVYSYAISIAREVQLNSTLREEIVDIPEANLSVEWSEFNEYAPLTLSKITNKTPNYLECRGQICATDDPCLLSENPDKTVYAESVIISSSIETYNPRILKLFCWEM